MTAERKTRGAGDPDRPGRLIDAALALMLEQGVHALNHRAVAARANVPLGSTTYYFKDLDALLLAAIQRLTEQTQRDFDGWGATVASASELPERLSLLMHDRLTRQRAQAALCYELYVLAMRRPALKDASEAWMRVLKHAIARHVGRDKADATVALIDGLMIQGLMAPKPPSVKTLRYALNSILG